MSLKNFIVLILSLSLVIGAVLTGGCVSNEPTTIETPTQTIKDITAQEAFDLIQDNRNDPDFVILDVRTAAEFAEGHIENAENIDFYAATFRDELDNLDKSQTYLIYCQSGNRSGQARDIMAELDFEEVYNVLGGILDWQAEGLPTVK
jgi:rhodanese-related sulfurtransferase